MSLTCGAGRPAGEKDRPQPVGVVHSCAASRRIDTVLRYNCLVLQLVHQPVMNSGEQPSTLAGAIRLRNTNYAATSNNREHKPHDRKSWCPRFESGSRHSLKFCKSGINGKASASVPRLLHQSVHQRARTTSLPTGPRLLAACPPARGSSNPWSPLSRSGPSSPVPPWDALRRPA
jgi:hypothetical protein